MLARVFFTLLALITICNTQVTRRVSNINGAIWAPSTVYFVYCGNNYNHFTLWQALVCVVKFDLPSGTKNITIYFDTDDYCEMATAVGPLCNSSVLLDYTGVGSTVAAQFPLRAQDVTSISGDYNIKILPSPTGPTNPVVDFASSVVPNVQHLFLDFSPNNGQAKFNIAITNITFQNYTNSQTSNRGALFHFSSSAPELVIDVVLTNVQVNGVKSIGPGFISTGPGSVFVTANDCSFNLNQGGIGTSETHGAVFTITSGQLIMNGGSATRNTIGTSGAGFAVITTAGSFQLNPSGSSFTSFRNNRLANSAVFAFTGTGTHTLNNFEAIGNAGYSYGFAYVTAGAQISINNAVFSQNTVNFGPPSTYMAGIFYISGTNAATGASSKVTISNSNFTNNRIVVTGLSSAGCFVVLNQGVLVVNSGLFTSNIATTSTAGSAGVFVVVGGTVNVYGGTFDGNLGSLAGVGNIAALSNIIGTFTAATNTVFSNNNGTLSAGGFDISGGSIAEFDGIVATQNSGRTGAGFINVNTASDVTITASTISENFLTSTSNSVGGGAILVASDSSLTVTSTTFSNNHAPIGGAIYVTGGSTATLDQSIFTENTALSGYGGAVVVGNGPSATGIITSTFSAINSQFISNMGTSSTPANNLGGAIYLAPYSYVYVDTSSFSFNYANQGGAIYTTQHKQTQLAITSTTDGQTIFFNNSARTQGGAVWSYGELITITDSNFTNNYAPLGGACVFLDINPFTSSQILVETSYFINNYATGAASQGFAFSGGAIYSQRGLYLEAVQFSGNYAQSGHGGAIVIGGESKLDNCQFISNYCTGSSCYGGAVYVNQFSLIPLSMTITSFLLNSAGYGGAVYTKSDWNAQRDVFQSNSAVIAGGAIYSPTGSTGTVDVSTFQSNSAAQAGAIFSNSDVTITSSNFRFNRATSGSGGALECETLTTGLINSAVTVTGSTFTSNSASSYGGAISSSCDANFNTVTFVGNSAGVTGGAFHCNGTGRPAGFNGTENPCTTSILSSTFTSNSAPGAGSFDVDGIFVISKSTFNQNSNIIISYLGGATSIIDSNFLTGSNVTAVGDATVSGSSFQQNTYLINSGKLQLSGSSFFQESVLNVQEGSASIHSTTFSLTSALSVDSQGSSTLLQVIFQTESSLQNSGVSTTRLCTWTASGISNSNGTLSVVSGTFTSSTISNDATLTLFASSLTSSTISTSSSSTTNVSTSTLSSVSNVVASGYSNWNSVTFSGNSNFQSNTNAILTSVMMSNGDITNGGLLTTTSLMMSGGNFQNSGVATNNKATLNSVVVTNANSLTLDQSSLTMSPISDSPSASTTLTASNLAQSSHVTSAGTLAVRSSTVAFSNISTSNGQIQDSFVLTGSLNARGTFLSSNSTYSSAAYFTSSTATISTSSFSQVSSTSSTIDATSSPISSSLLINGGSFTANYGTDSQTIPSIMISSGGLSGTGTITAGSLWVGQGTIGVANFVLSSQAIVENQLTITGSAFTNNGNLKFIAPPSNCLSINGGGSLTNNKIIEFSDGCSVTTSNGGTITNVNTIVLNGTQSLSTLTLRPTSFIDYHVTSSGYDNLTLTTTSFNFDGTLRVYFSATPVVGNSYNLIKYPDGYTYDEDTSGKFNFSLYYPQPLSADPTATYTSPFSASYDTEFLVLKIGNGNSLMSGFLVILILIVVQLMMFM